MLCREYEPATTTPYGGGVPEGSAEHRTPRPNAAVPATGWCTDRHHVALTAAIGGRTTGFGPVADYAVNGLRSGKSCESARASRVATVARTSSGGCSSRRWRCLESRGVDGCLTPSDHRCIVVRTRSLVREAVTCGANAGHAGGTNQAFASRRIGGGRGCCIGSRCGGCGPASEPGMLRREHLGARERPAGPWRRRTGGCRLCAGSVRSSRARRWGSTASGWPRAR